MPILMTIPALEKRLLGSLLPILLISAIAARAAPAAEGWFQIHVVDADTGRGVPLVELETVDHVLFVTDSAGRVAFGEPGLMGKTVFLSVRSHGYEFARDGFGYAGARLETAPGGKAVLKVRRLNVAERLYRITGAGIYRDSVLLGETVPLAEPLLNAQVLGQDSTQAAVYHGKIYWFWGDTSQLKYPLGNFRTTGATSALPGQGGLDPAEGINLSYFKNPEGFTKGMCPFEPKDGMVWIDGLLTAKDEAGRERLVTHFARMKSLAEMLEHGLGIFNDEKEEFERLATFKLDDPWRCPRGHVLRDRDGGQEYLYSCVPFPCVRVRAELKSIIDPASYEAWTPLADGSEAKPGKARLLRDEKGLLVHRWTGKAPPLSPEEEQALVGAGLMKASEAGFLPADVESGKPVKLHGGSVHWNPWRQRWVLVAVEIGGTSHLGEIWYAEARRPEGPWRRARKIVTHDRYTFYNPVHHEFFDQAGGRVIHFEGTYTNQFSGNPNFTPRYDYNQILYRLDLADPRLKGAQE